MRKPLIAVITGDAVLALVALYASFMMRFGDPPLKTDYFSLFGIIKISIFAITAIFTSYLLEVYNFEKTCKLREILVKSIVSSIVAFFILSSIYYIAPSLLLGRGLLFLSLLTFGLLQFIWHLACNKGMNLPHLTSRVLILGTGPLAKQIGGLLSANNSYLLAGYYDCSNEAIMVPEEQIVGNGAGLDVTAIREKTEKIVVSLSERRGKFPLKEVLNCKFSGIQIVDAPSFYEQVTGKLLLENITPSWFIFADGFNITNFNMICKRVMDILLSSMGMLLSMPLMPFIMMVVKLDSNGPIFFKQVRLGIKEKSFVLYKFRTMGQYAERETGAVWSQKDDPRVTKIGIFLRKTRLDEIPQLYNVFKGDMSFVGPRPERPEFVAKLKEIIPYYSNRHFLKPGLTGWAQVRYPYGASVEDAIEKLRYDLYYIKNLSPFLDMLVVLETIKVVLFSRGGR